MSDTNLDPTQSSAASGPTDHMSIGEVLGLLQGDFPDISISKIRFLESRGLVEPHRAPSGYRKFSDVDLERLRWILTMQRDHFLPLRVIKERLEEGPPPSVDDSDGASVMPASMAPEPRTKTSRFRAPGPASDDLDPAELSRLSGLSAQQVDQLVQFGLLDVADSGTGPRFTPDQLGVAKAAAAFLAHGIEARHLKAWRVAAEREAGMLEQIVVPMTRKGSASSSDKARDVAEDLVDMGNVIRETIIVNILRKRLGSGSD